MRSESHSAGRSAGYNLGEYSAQRDIAIDSCAKVVSKVDSSDNERVLQMRDSLGSSLYQMLDNSMESMVGGGVVNHIAEIVTSGAVNKLSKILEEHRFGVGGMTPIPDGFFPEEGGMTPVPDDFYPKSTTTDNSANMGAGSEEVPASHPTTGGKPANMGAGSGEGAAPHPNVDAQGVPANDNAADFEDQIAKYRRLVPKEHINAKELNILKDAVAKGNEDDIKAHLIKNNIADIKLEMRSGSTDDKRGFFGALFSRTLSNGEKVYFEANKGTDPFTWAPKDTYAHIEDLAADDRRIFEFKIPSQAKSSEAFHRQVKSYIGENAKLYGLGFSLGNALIQITGTKYHNDFTGIVGFDGPGMQEILSKDFGKENMKSLQGKLVLFNGRPHRINAHGTHVVKPIVVEHDGNTIPDNSIFEERTLFKYALNIHNGELMTGGFDENGPVKMVPIDNWPVSKGFSASDELKSSFYNYEFNKEAWDTSFVEKWKQNPVIIPGDIGQQRQTLQEFYGSFENYKGEQVKFLDQMVKRYEKEK